MEYKDYYKILGVDKTTGKEELKKKYRALARQFHPDANPDNKNAGAKFAEISEAYEVLSDDEKRKKYEQLGAEWEQHQNAGKDDHFDWSKYASAGQRQSGGQSQAGGGQNWDDIFGQDSDSSDFFRTIFGQQFGAAQSGRFARKGADLSAELALSFEDAYHGGPKTITVGDHQIRLTLKPGIWDRQTIKIAGKGAPGSNGAESGDLYLTFIIQPHAEYRVEGTDLHRNISVSIYAALLGTTMEVQTISGKFKFTIPPETKNGTVLKLKGKGFPLYGKSGVQGDLFLKVVLQLPEKLTPQEQKLIRELAAIRNIKVKGESE